MICFTGMYQVLPTIYGCFEGHFISLFEVNHRMFHPFSVGTSLKIRHLFGKHVFQDVFRPGHHISKTCALYVTYLD